MTKAFSILATALLGAAFLGVTAVSAQTKAPGAKCGPESFSQSDMTYKGVPCNGETATQASAQTSSTACKPEGFSSTSMGYTSVPCPPGTTYENPGWKGPKIPK
jgi:hypothetical protein